jgi:hypothetical protein
MEISERDGQYPAEVRIGYLLNAAPKRYIYVSFV